MRFCTFFYDFAGDRYYTKSPLRDLRKEVEALGREFIDFSNYDRKDCRTSNINHVSLAIVITLNAKATQP